MRVLHLYRPVNYVNQLAAELKAHDPNYIPSVLLDEYEERTDLNDIYENQFAFKTTLKTFIFYIQKSPSFVVFLTYSMSLLVLNRKQGLKSFACVFSAMQYVGRIQYANLDAYDVLHFHYVNIVRAMSVLLLQKRSKVVVTFWGSDLFRSNGLANNFWLRKALHRADVINLSSVEMQETLLAEFGRELKDKIRFSIFLPSSKLLELIRKNKGNIALMDSFRQKYEIKKGTTCVTIGNNGNVGNNHIQVLESIAQVGDMQHATFLLPLTYGLDPAYASRLDQCIQKLNLRVVTFHSFLSWDDLSALRLITDVFITMQETDAMSAVLMESLYAGNICIVGSWLPYSTFRESGSHYLTCKDFDELGPLVADVLNNLERNKQKSKNNELAVYSKFYDVQSLIKGWKNVYTI